MIELRFDIREFGALAKQVGGALDQVPFALSLALNQAAEAARGGLIAETWPKAVTVRRSNFLRWALTRERATKSNLAVAITDVKAQGRGSLLLHARGGIKQPKAGTLAIPNTAVVRRTGQGVVRSQRPRNLANSFRKGDALFQRDKRRKRLRLMYVLQRSARQPADVPFDRDFAATMAREVRARFPAAMARAMATRRA